MLAQIDFYWLHFQVFTRLQKLMVSVSHRTTISVMDGLAEGHDEKVFEWQDSLKEALPTPSQDQVFISLLIRVTVCLISNTIYFVNFRSWQS